MRPVFIRRTKLSTERFRRWLGARNKHQERRVCEFCEGRQAAREPRYPLFGDLFLQGETEDTADFANEYLRKVPENSRVSGRLIGREAQNLHIPWGLLYDRSRPSIFSMHRN